MKSKRQFLILAAFSALIVAYHIFGYIGHYGYDDLHYAKISNDILNGRINYNDHFTFRTPILFLTSLSYSVFGVSDFASSLPSILISLILLFIVFNLLKDIGNRTLIIGLALTALSNWFIFYSDKIMTDIYVALSVILSLYIIHQYRYRNENKRSIVFSLLLIFALLFGFMSKGTIILIIPLLLYLFGLDILYKRNQKFWLYTILGGLVIILIYFVLIWLITGDLFKRFEAIANNSYLNLCSYDKQPVGILLKRILYEFFGLLIYQGLTTGFIFVLAILTRKGSLRIFKMEDSFSFWAISAILLLLSSNFMSISFTSYSPMCLDPRHYLFLVPVVSIPASIIIKNFIEDKAFKISIIALLIGVTIISYFLPGDDFWKLYFPLSLLFLAYLLFKKSLLTQTLFIALFMVILLIKPIAMIHYAQKINYGKQKEIFIDYILNSNENRVVITNDVQKRLGEYYKNFGKGGKVTLLDYKEFKYDSTDNRTKILFLNWYTRYLSGMDNHDLPYYAKNISNGNKLLYQNDQLNISIYEMSDFSIPEQTGKLLFYSINNFEHEVDYWKQDDKNLTREIKYQGNSSIQVWEFSSTFEYYIDSLDLKSITELMISCSVYCNFPDKTGSKLIISVENDEGAYIWDAVEINKYIKAYSNWWLVKHELAVKKKDLKSNSRLKIYIWNVDKQKAYVDDFQVKIFGTK